jgi:hypothetical protein
VLYNDNTVRFDSAWLVERGRRAGVALVDDHGCDALWRRYLRTEPPPCGELYRVGDARVA